MVAERFYAGRNSKITFKYIYVATHVLLPHVEGVDELGEETHLMGCKSEMDSQLAVH